MTSETEKLPLKAFRGHPSRWYVITIVSLASVLNNDLWATWGPIAQSAKLVYQWSDTTLFWIVNSGNIAGFVFTILGGYLVDKKGIRVSMLVLTTSMGLASLSRVITMEPSIATILICAGQVLNGVATTITMTIPPAVSEAWFHVDERTTATVIGAMAAVLGGASSSLLGPLLVSMPVTNNTEVLLNQTDVHLIKHQIATLNYITFGFAMALLLLCIIYLPAKPPWSPSKTSTISRYNFREGVIKLVRMPRAWCIGMMYAFPTGIYGSWSSVLDVILNPLGISQTEAGWMGFYGSLGGIVAALVMGRFADIHKRRTKPIIVVNYTVGAVSFAWFACMCYKLIPHTPAQLYISCILGSMFISSCGPLFLEIMCETTYPIAEGVSAGFLGMFVNLAAAVLLALNQIPTIGTAWMSATVCVVFVAAVPVVALFPVQYRRVDIDTGSQAENQPGRYAILQETDLQSDDVPSKCCL